MVANGLRELSNISMYTTYDTGFSVHEQHKDLLGDDAYTFVDGYAKLLDDVIVTSNRYLFTKSQEAFFKEFLVEADKVTAGTITEDEMSGKFKQLNEFLGNYKGEENE